MITTPDSELTLKDFDYFLPQEMIAQEPLPKRDQSRMMVLRRNSDVLEHSHFYQFPAYLNPGDLLVLNDTRVIPARLPGRRAGSGGKVEFLLLHHENNSCWQVMVKPGRRLRVGARVEFGSGLEASVRRIWVEVSAWWNSISRWRSYCPGWEGFPCPLILKRGCRSDLYQTIYAHRIGSAAAPTAGFHFTPAIFEELSRLQIGRIFITLHRPGCFFNR